MPELPDLQVFSANLNRQLAGKTLVKVSLPNDSRANVSAAKLKSSLEGEKLSKVYREGKELRFAFANENVLGIHLMLRGKLSWVEKDDIPSHTLLILEFDKRKQLALSDYQHNARIFLNPEPSVAPDILSKEINVKFWKEKLQSKATIKNLLLDQHVIRGIGNAYADEILWEARISPFSKSNKVPPERINALAKSISKVLKNAEKQIKKEEPGIIGGELRDFLVVHNSKKKKSPEGATIKIKSSAGRRTYYTDEQELFV